MAVQRARLEAQHALDSLLARGNAPPKTIDEATACLRALKETPLKVQLAAPVPHGQWAEAGLVTCRRLEPRGLGCNAERLARHTGSSSFGKSMLPCFCYVVSDLLFHACVCLMQGFVGCSDNCQGS